MNDGVVVGIFVALWMIRELIPLMLRLQQRRRSDPPPAPPPPRQAYYSSPDIPVDISVGEVYRAQQRQEAKIDRIRSILREQPKEVQDAIRRHLEAERVSRPDLRRLDDEE